MHPVYVAKGFHVGLDGKLTPKPTQSPPRKFVAQFGHAAFLEFYYPQYKLHGTPHLPGVCSLWLEAEAAAKKAACDKKSKNKFRKSQIQKSLSLMPCDLPFYPNRVNFVSPKEHDKNRRKYWFLVIDAPGLFTFRRNTEAYASEPRHVLEFFTREIVPDSEEESDSSKEASLAPASLTPPRHSTHSKPAPAALKADEKHPRRSGKNAGRNTVKHEPTSVKRETPASIKQETPAIKVKHKARSVRCFHNCVREDAEQRHTRQGSAGGGAAQLMLGVGMHRREWCEMEASKLGWWNQAAAGGGGRSRADRMLAAEGAERGYGLVKLEQGGVRGGVSQEKNLSGNWSRTELGDFEGEVHASENNGQAFIYPIRIAAYSVRIISYNTSVTRRYNASSYQFCCTATALPPPPAKLLLPPSDQSNVSEFEFPVLFLAGAGQSARDREGGIDGNMRY
ncbi:hypothetical protein C8R43DRAFT_961101 [Mycena crocata]|nr:hypothetical protein C8R43DRAFT_961101 [Mycena crocata]